MFDICPRELALSDAAADEYDRLVKPDVFIVIHLRRSLHGVPGTAGEYEKVALRLLVDLTKKTIGTRAFRRRRPGHRLLPNLTGLEWRGGPHLNLLVRKPRSCSFNEFDRRFREVWSASAWASPGINAVYCQKREPGTSLVGYIAKEGIDALLLRTLSF